MAEHDRSLSRAELLKRGALGVAAAGSVDALLGTGVASAASAAPKPGGTLNVGIGQTFEDINVLTAFGYRWGQLMAYAMYDTLVKFDNSGHPVPLLATKWETPNPKTTIVTIRQGVKFHDGTPMRVDDVVWSLNRINSATKPVSNNFLALPADIWGEAVKLSNTQLRITTKKPTRQVESWRFWFIMPENADTRKPDMGVQPVGTGPFQFKDFVKGDRLDLTRFDSYWNKPEPYLDNLTFKFQADAAAQVANFLSGNVNYLHDLSVATLPQVQGKNNSKLIPSGIFFEWWQPQMYFGPLADMNVRLALQYAFDKDTDNKVAWAGRGLETWNPWQKSPYYIGKPYPVTFDPDKAKSLLAKAGQPNLKLNMMTLSAPGPWQQESVALQQGFQKAGITATIQPLPAAQWFDRLYTKRNHDGIAVNAGSLPFPWALAANYMMKATLLPNPPKYPKPVLPALTDAYNLAFSSANEAQYSSAIKTIQRLMNSQAAVFHTMMASNQNVAPQNLQGVESTQFGDQRFAGAYFS